ncbi:MAG: SUMF1/EgtB/PvdO family nonheme iron enzyme [Kiritimatiellae bacterium]|nr:SUMF1/EgtB/PvdO family nonheme iron enzyme [Kiritimatiellia bacterium]
MTTPIKKLMLAMVAATAICLGARAANEDKTWMVVDLRTGALSHYGYDLATATNTFNTPLYKTEKMVFRRISEELYYVCNGASVAVMGRPYYVGMFPVTVAQYNLMLDPSAAVSETAENLRAIVNVSYATLRGSQNVPAAFGGGLGDGPISRLNTRVTAKLGPFDLPTESMWEVAARAIEAGDETHKTWPWFFGASDSLLSQYAFFNDSAEADAYGLTSGSRVPGGKLPNAWGFYDIYGNVYDRTLDTCPNTQSSETESLSQTPQSAYTNFRNCGGSFANGSDRCRREGRASWRRFAACCVHRFRDAGMAHCRGRSFVHAA